MTFCVRPLTDLEVTPSAKTYDCRTQYSPDHGIEEVKTILNHIGHSLAVRDARRPNDKIRAYRSRSHLLLLQSFPLPFVSLQKLKTRTRREHEWHGKVYFIADTVQSVCSWEKQKTNYNDITTHTRTLPVFSGQHPLAVTKISGWGRGSTRRLSDCNKGHEGYSEGGKIQIQQH